MKNIHLPHWGVCYYAFSATAVVNSALCTVSLLTTSAMSVNRLLALSLGMRYSETVTTKRVYGIIITFWVLATAASAIYVRISQFTSRFIQTVLLIFLSASVFSHTMSFFNLRQLCTPVQDRRSREDPPIACSILRSEASRIAKYKKAVSSVLWVQLALLICYLPYTVIVALHSIRGELSQTLVLSQQYAGVFVLVNSSLNPLLYCWKILEVRQAFVATLKKWRCSSTYPVLCLTGMPVTETKGRELKQTKKSAATNTYLKI